jgi:hypothetical protein
MKTLTLIFAVLAAAVAGRADGLKQNLVPADARWLLHLDGDAFRKSRIGAMIVEEKGDAKIKELEAETKQDFDFSFKKIKAITVFGPKVGEEDNGVMLLQTTADVAKDLEKLTNMKAAAGGSADPGVSRITIDGNDAYTVGKDLNLMAAGADTWVLSKNRASMLSARNVAMGKAAALKNAAFLEYPTVTNSFFFLAFADASGVDKLPAQAQILKKADGGRIVMGESGDKVFLDISLKSKDNDALAQIKQVVQGLIAIVSLSQGENKDLMALANSAAVSSTNQMVSLSLSFPLDRAMKKVREQE